MLDIVGRSGVLLREDSIFMHVMWCLIISRYPQCWLTLLISCSVINLIVKSKPQVQVTGLKITSINFEKFNYKKHSLTPTENVVPCFVHVQNDCKLSCASSFLWFINRRDTFSATVFHRWPLMIVGKAMILVWKCLWLELEIFTLHFLVDHCILPEKHVRILNAFIIWLPVETRHHTRRIHLLPSVENPIIEWF